MLQIDHFSIGTLPIDLLVTGDFPDISVLPIDLSVVPIEKWVSKRHILYTKNIILYHDILLLLLPSAAAGGSTAYATTGCQGMEQAGL